MPTEPFRILLLDTQKKFCYSSVEEDDLNEIVFRNLFRNRVFVVLLAPVIVPVFFLCIGV